MAKKRKTPLARAKKLGVAYAQKLEVLRKLKGEFAAKKWDRLREIRPRSEKGKAAKRRELARVNRAFNRVRPYVNRGFKWAKPANKKNFETLRKFVGVPRFKGLRAIPVPTQAKRLSVRFDRRGRPTIREDGVEQKIFLFPHAPRDHVVKVPGKKGKHVDAQDDAVAMLKDMLPTMPNGFYIFFSRHHFLIPEIVERDRLLERVRAFYSQYGKSPEFLALLAGFKWLTDSDEDLARIEKEMSSERERLKAIRKRARVAKALKQVLKMDRALKGGRISARARATGRR